MRNLTILSIVSFLQDLSSEMIFPILTIIISKMNMPIYMGLMEGIAEFTSNMLKLFSGYLHDRIGRAKRMVIIGYFVSFIGKVIYPFATSGIHIVAGRFIDRIGKGIRTSPRDALLSRSVPQSIQGLAFGIHRFSDTLGAIAGPILVLLLMNQMDERNLLILALIPSLLAVFMLLLLKDVDFHHKGKFKLVFDKRFSRFILFIFLISLASFSVGFYMMDAGSKASIVGSYILFNIMYALSSLIGGRLFDMNRNLLFGLPFILGFSSLISIIQLSVIHIAIYGIYFGLFETLPKAYIGSLEDERKGMLYGIYYMVSGSALLFGNLIAGFLFEYKSYIQIFLSVLSLFALKFLNFGEESQSINT